MARWVWLDGEVGGGWALDICLHSAAVTGVGRWCVEGWVGDGLRWRNANVYSGSYLLVD